ncbi:type I CRISPR-associated protein Cas7 [Marinitenerispora sediminis]|uniref:Type I-C CRISPR-associated protein Cas7/Csd2 n=1 Tax=Marinitenerispora sediminis TaxID=1931232 RepID=A0A368T1P0_9ACTN|nr:type I CRISPR-associated protein Cas7 [Marinitenerispora sediminis]RCV53959.1 type I-C CRISPR-associated protein Cas7/Csd2 [Marinitenerispora sediminis]RCV57090.1 type I-C CRISPR-associated protein Cas7/Csd2 [Marinitenerispora sediminis]RCV58915.1 type I-C CRISPR-associated protein Cas7/Csd2 [Marinitenerispora sediminis]
MSTPTTDLTAHLDPARKHDFVFLFDVRDGNPNGDPDAGGAPRTDPETGQGIVTDVAVKRKIRNMVALLGEKKPGYDIYVEAGVALNAQHKRAYAELDLTPGQAGAEDKARDWMCEAFFDVRMFGAVMSTGTAQESAAAEDGESEPTSKSKGKGKKAKTTRVRYSCGRVQGPVQLTFSRSVDVVLPLENGITRVTQTREEDVANGESTEIGTKHTIPYGLYRGHGYFSAPLARRTGVTHDDLDMFWRAFTLAFEHDRAATRGEMTLRGLYVFTHDDAFGRVPAGRLFDLLRIDRAQKDGPVTRSFNDYTVQIDAEAVPAGVTLTTLLG